MKTTLKLAVVIAFFALCSNVSAQNIKLAHININELIPSMPEYDSAAVKIEKVKQELEETIEGMQVEFNKKYEEFKKNEANWTELVKQSKMEELTSMNQRLQTFQQQASESYQRESDKLLQPVYEKANKAIEAVAKEKGIDYVISDNVQILLFKSVGTVDLLPAVKQYLGIKK